MNKNYSYPTTLYNMGKYFDPNISISCIIYNFCFWPWNIYKQKLEKIFCSTRNLYILAKILYHIVVG